MNASEATLQQIERALRKAASKFPAGIEPLPLTDIFLQVKQESGELLIFDDDDTELTRCVVEEWIGNTSEAFYDEVQELLHGVLVDLKEVTENFNVLKPYNFVLMDEDKDLIADLYVVDDDTIVLSGALMAGLNDDLDKFWEELQKE
ncbi:MAG: hypothetical protein Q4E59_07675 [Bacteroidales bacterium]|nr:hypothetical protein [Bacteroidales bacterium]